MSPLRIVVALGLIIACRQMMLSARADEPTLLQQVQGASLCTTAPVGKDKALALSFTEILSLRIEVEGGPALEVKAPERWTDGPWQVRVPDKPSVAMLPTGRRQWTQNLRVEPLAPGEVVLALAPLQVRNEDGAWETIRWKPLAVHVTSRLTQPDLKSARDITAIEELPAPPPRSFPIGTIAVSGGIAATLALLVAFGLRRRRAVTRSTTPEAWATYELGRLQALKLPERGQSERFATLLAGLLRRYVEKKYQIPARRQTTGDFLAATAARPELAEHQGFLRVILERCDVLKFAPVTTTQEECERLVADLRQYVVMQERRAHVSIQTK
jgi:hypothetical protein